MAFRTGTGSAVSFDRAFEQLESLALTIKNLSQSLRDRSAAGTMTGEHVLRYFTDVGNTRLLLTDWVNKFTGQAAEANAYAQDRYNDPTYDAQAEYNTLLTEVNDVLNYIETNVPTSLLSWDAAGGVVTWNSFTVGATAGLRTELDALIAAVD